MYRIFLYLRRRGFTLAEILVATVIAGYCIMPIVGSMQGGIRHTENFNHREKLRILARSRLNKELAAGAFDHSAINSETMYHHVFHDDNTNNYLTFETNVDSTNASFSDILATYSLPVTADDLIYSYKISVQTKENVSLATTSINIDPDLLASPRGLKAVVVSAELLDGPYVIATDSISYFSLLALPSFGDQFIWLSNSSMLRILAVDASTRAISETFQLPYDTTKALDKAEQDFRPWNIDLHPSRRVLGVQSRQKIRLLNIDKSHPSYQQTSGFVDVASHPGTDPDPTKNKFADVKANSSKAEEDRGIVFRPDGKYFFVSSHSDKSLYVYKIDVATDTLLNWPPPVAFVKRFGLKAAEEGTADTEHDKFTDMIAGNDGYLYLSIKDKKNIIRFPMYPSSFTSGWTFEEIIKPTVDKAVNSVWTSKDGKYIYILDNEYRVAQFRSHPLGKIGYATLYSDDKMRDFKLSHDSKYLMVTDIKNATNKGGLRIKQINEINFAGNPSIADADMSRVYPGYALKSDLCVLSPTGYEVLFSHKDQPELYFADIASAANNAYSSNLPTDQILVYDSSGKPCADIVTRVPEFMLVGTGNSAADSTIEFFDLHTFKFDEDRRITGLRGVPRTIGVSPQGTRFKIGYDTATKSVDAFNMIDSTMISSNELSGSGKIVSYAADDETVRHATGIATYSDNFYANLEIPGTTNGYWIQGAPGGSFGDSGMDVAWVPQDMKAMPNGGFLMLFKKSDGTAMLDWIGKVKWGPSDRGRYKRFARWITTAHNQFPPALSQNIAISPDEQFLAIETSGTPNLVYLYDFGACNFGHETQLEGWLADYRVQSQPVTAANPASWIFGNVAANTYFTVPNVTNSSTTGIRLKDSVTSNESWTSMVNFPSNFIVNSGDPVTGGTNPSKRDVNRRYFGYFTPDYLANKFLVYSRDYARMFYNHEPKGYWANTGSDGSFGSAIGQIASTTSVIQTDYMTNGGNVKLGLFTHTNSVQATGTISADGSSEASNLDMDTSWTRIASAHTRPFNFKPVFLRSYPLTGCNGDSANALTFSRDLANPILFALDAGNDDLWALKPGKSLTRITNGLTFDMADKQLVISPDGQKLIFAQESGTNQLFVYDIGNPDLFSFNGVATTPVSGFGSLITKVPVSNNPRALGAMPFNSYKSTSRLGKYEWLASITPAVYGNNSAALASGGIFIMGGSPTFAGAPVTTIGKFNPMDGVAFAAMATTLNKAVKFNSVVAYDNKLYCLNGTSGTTHTGGSDWVQCYDPVSGSLMHSFDQPIAGKLSPVGAPATSDYTNKLYTYNTALGTVIVSCDRHDSGEYASKAFDGTKSGSSQWDSDANCPNWIEVVFPIPVYIDELRLYIISGQGPHAFQVQAYDGVATTTIYSGSTANSTGEQSFPMTTPGYYYAYRIYCSSSWDTSNTDIEIPEVELWNNTPVMAGYPILTKIMNDARTTAKRSSSSACMTPYGIISAGGRNESGTITNTAFVYWPHAIDEYTDAINHSFGISRALPTMTTPVYGHSLVWHKGKLYRIGGFIDTAAPPNNASNIDIFDFDTNAWTTPGAASFTDITGANTTLPQPAYAGVCSFGDEIFIFGGKLGAAFTNQAWAWNPETKVVRQLDDMPQARAYHTAVPCGSAIYIVGGAKTDSSDTESPIYKFTP